MDQKKTGEFLKQLRREKGWTQEQLAERMLVSARTVSRWETGSNMPDLSTLTTLADLYKTDIREILDGERKPAKMDKQLEATVQKIVEYSAEDKRKVTRRIHLLFIGGFIASVVYTALYFVGCAENFFGGLCLGITFGVVIVGVIMTSRHADRIRTCKLRLLRRNAGPTGNR